MKKMHEGATVVGAIFLLLSAVGFFLFNVYSQHEKNKIREKEEKKIEKLEKQHSERTLQYQRDMQEQKEELDNYKKMNDPLWHYYDPQSKEYKVYPGLMIPIVSLVIKI